MGIADSSYALRHTHNAEWDITLTNKEINKISDAFQSLSVPEDPESAIVKIQGHSYTSRSYRITKADGEVKVERIYGWLHKFFVRNHKNAAVTAVNFKTTRHLTSRLVYQAANRIDVITSKQHKDIAQEFWKLNESELTAYWKQIKDDKKAWSVFAGICNFRLDFAENSGRDKVTGKTDKEAVSFVNKSLGYLVSHYGIKGLIEVLPQLPDDFKIYMLGLDLWQLRQFEAYKTCLMLKLPLNIVTGYLQTYADNRQDLNVACKNLLNCGDDELRSLEQDNSGDVSAFKFESSQPCEQVYQIIAGFPADVSEKIINEQLNFRKLLLFLDRCNEEFKVKFFTQLCKVKQRYAAEIFSVIADGVDKRSCADQAKVPLKPLYSVSPADSEIKDKAQDFRNVRLAVSLLRKMTREDGLALCGCCSFDFKAKAKEIYQPSVDSPAPERKPRRNTLNCLSTGEYTASAPAESSVMANFYGARVNTTPAEITLVRSKSVHCGGAEKSAAAWTAKTKSIDFEQTVEWMKDTGRELTISGNDSVTDFVAPESAAADNGSVELPVQVTKALSELKAAPTYNDFKGEFERFDHAVSVCYRDISQSENKLMLLKVAYTDLLKIQKSLYLESQFKVEKYCVPFEFLRNKTFTAELMKLAALRSETALSRLPEPGRMRKCFEDCMKIENNQKLAQAKSILEGLESSENQKQDLIKKARQRFQELQQAHFLPKDKKETFCEYTAMIEREVRVQCETDCKRAITELMGSDKPAPFEKVEVFIEIIHSSPPFSAAEFKRMYLETICPYCNADELKNNPAFKSLSVNEREVLFQQVRKHRFVPVSLSRAHLDTIMRFDDEFTRYRDTEQTDPEARAAAQLVCGNSLFDTQLLQRLSVDEPVIFIKLLSELPLKSMNAKEIYACYQACLTFLRGKHMRRVLKSGYFTRLPEDWLKLAARCIRPPEPRDKHGYVAQLNELKNDTPGTQGNQYAHHGIKFVAEPAYLAFDHEQPLMQLLAVAYFMSTYLGNYRAIIMPKNGDIDNDKKKEIDECRGAINNLIHLGTEICRISLPAWEKGKATQPTFLYRTMKKGGYVVSTDFCQPRGDFQLWKKKQYPQVI